MTFSSASSPPKLDVNDQAEAKLQYEQSLTQFSSEWVLNKKKVWLLESGMRPKL